MYLDPGQLIALGGLDAKMPALDRITLALETHAHADHLSAAPHLQEHLGGRTGIGKHIKDVHQIFKKIFNTETTFRADGSQFDYLFRDGEEFNIGSLTAKVMHTPGHTPACLTYADQRSDGAAVQVL